MSDETRTGRSASRGAWIEIEQWWCKCGGKIVAPPRAERGLKCYIADFGRYYFIVAPPRAERGLKWQMDNNQLAEFLSSLRLARSVD